MTLDTALRAAVALMVAILGWWSHRTKRAIDQVHVLVNSNLDDIKSRLDAMTAERDQLQEFADDPSRDFYTPTHTRPRPGPTRSTSQFPVQPR